MNSGRLLFLGNIQMSKYTALYVTLLFIHCYEHDSFLTGADGSESQVKVSARYYESGYLTQSRALSSL